MKTKIRELRPNDMESFIQLCEARPNLSREQAEKRAAIVEWVAFNNPYADGNPTYFVGAQDDKVLAHLGRMPTLFGIQGQQELASYFHDLYVHPELRKSQAQGFFLTMNMYRKAEKASKSFCAMIWTNEINIALQKARKYEQMWSDRRVMILGMSKKLETKVPRRLRRSTQSSVRKIITTTNWLNGLRLESKGIVEQFARYDKRFDELAQRCAPTMMIAPYKDHKYLNWKYVDRPGLQGARFQLLDESGKVTGFSEVVYPDATLTSAIAELVVVDNNKESIQALLGETIDHLKAKGADRIEAVASDDSYSDALHDRIFRRDIRVPIFLAKCDRSPHANYLRSPKHWHLSLGDSEGPF